MAKRRCNPSIAWNVYLRGKLIDTVFFTTDYTAEEVRRSLIDHDGYDSGITVRRQAKSKTSANPAEIHALVRRLPDGRVQLKINPSVAAMFRGLKMKATRVGRKLVRQIKGKGMRRRRPLGKHTKGKR